MQTVPKRMFTHEYRAEAVKLVLAEGLGVTVAARKLGLSVKTYSKWIRDARSGVLARVDTHRLQPVSDLQAEVSRLKRELAIEPVTFPLSTKATRKYESNYEEIDAMIS